MTNLSGKVAIVTGAARRAGSGKRKRRGSLAGCRERFQADWKTGGSVHSHCAEHLRRGSPRPHMLWIGLPRRKAAPRNDSQAILNFHPRRRPPPDAINSQ
jgi:hypothetical protein